LGAEISVPSTYSESTLEVIDRLKQESFIILALEQTKDSHSLGNYTFTSQGKYALVLGNEVEGVSDKVLKTCDDCIEIPQIGSKHSLNVANAASIVLWEFYKSRENANTI
jgi:tRNA G18 (ribose-2'-O)-methylase SpoU